MLNIAVLQNEARTVAQRQQTRLQAAIDENRELTAEEETADAADAAQLTRLTSQIQRAQQLSASVAAIGLDPVIAGAPATVPATVKPALDNGGFSNIADFANAVRMANPAAGSSFRMDERLAAPSNVHTETGDAAGSYLVPAEFRQEIVDLVYGGDDPVMTLIDPSPTSSNRVVGLGDESTPWGSSGVQAYWRGENQQMTATKAALTPRETKLGELYAFVLATEELLEDAPRTADLITRKAAGAIRWKAGEAFMWGDYIEKPQGWMTSAALVTVPKVSGQAADTIVRQNVAQMFARMINPTQAVWMANADCMPALMELKSDAGVPLWYPNYQDAPGGMLLGRPVYFTEHNTTVGDLGDLQLVNPNGYEAFRKQSGVSFAESIHLYFDHNVRAFRWTFRVGGQPVLSAPVSPAKGSATKSHFVALAERA
ncbi:MAG: phage major capsid protein [Novosphingobium sp.]|uniref:phage major capsid protein n=1 Tax=Novosphingobium sp. TaxID=1874826 RepID=UPI00273765B8|nr:phage major capsid protein [Novosphingobium sp.]MDP3550616.1 phage major capsid protein [Novosphingobium sp.]